MTGGKDVSGDRHYTYGCLCGVVCDLLGYLYDKNKKIKKHIRTGVWKTQT